MSTTKNPMKERLRNNYGEMIHAKEYYGKVLKVLKDENNRKSTADRSSIFAPDPVSDGTGKSRMEARNSHGDCRKMRRQPSCSQPLPEKLL